MSRLLIMLAGAATMAVGIAFLLWSATLYLTVQFGAPASGVLIGLFLLIVGSIVVTITIQRKPARRRGGPLGLLAHQAGAFTGLDEFEGLAALCERHPLAASLGALALGLTAGRRAKH